MDFFAATKTVDIYSRKLQNQEISLKRQLAEKMFDTFQPGKKVLGELVLKQMSICAKREQMNTNCYMLGKESGKYVTATLYNLKEEFPENAISEEAIRMADDEVGLDLGI